MEESIKTWFLRFGFNLFPCYRRSGARITYIAEDQREVRIKLPLNWKTRGYFGTTFGGSMYAAVDPVLMVMLNRLLGPDYMVWDKSASIRFLRPGKSTLYARFLVAESDLDQIRAVLQGARRMDHVYQVNLTDEAGVVHAEVEKVVNIRRKPQRASRRQM